MPVPPTDDVEALTRDAIVAAAITIADADGIDSVSMRKVADRVGSGAMSLYHHVQDKDDLFAAALEHVLTGVPHPTCDDEDWRTPLRTIVAWLRGTLQAHPWACELWPVTWPGPNRKQLMEAILRALREGGYDRRMAHHGFHALDVFVVGYVQQEAAFTIGQDDPEAQMQEFLAETPVETYPYMIEHIGHHMDEDAKEDSFEFLLELLLDGLERHR
ncbi:MAG: AcrR family transcriptional regulator [Nitriliruptoraceae bacterium]